MMTSVLPTLRCYGSMISTIQIEKLKIHMILVKDGKMNVISPMGKRNKQKRMKDKCRLSTPFITILTIFILKNSENICLF